MARFTFGGFGGDQVSLDPTLNNGFFRAGLSLNATGTFWSARTGGTQYTDLIDPNTLAALTGVSSSAKGQVVPFQGPNNVVEGWLDFGAGRFKVTAVDTGAPLTASVARALGWVIVTDPAYGAKGDGTSDDTAAIQAAINAANPLSFGGTVFFPPGQYQISSTLTVNASEVKLVGSGGNGSRIAVTTNVDALSFAAGLNRCAVRDLWIGSFSARTAGWGIKINGSSGSQPAYFDFQGVTVQNTYGGIYASYLQSSTWRNIKIFSTFSGGLTDVALSMIGSKSQRISDLYIVAFTGTTGSHGIQLDSECDTILISGAEILATGSDGVKFLNSVGGAQTGPRLVFMDKVLTERCAGHGFHFTAGRFTKLTNCWGSANTLDAFNIDGVDQCDLEQCHADQSGQHGFHWVSGAGPYSAVNCTANFNSQTTDNTYNGFQIDANVSHVRIEDGRAGNWLYSSPNGQKYGVRVEGSGTSSIVVQDNDLQGNKSAAVSWLTASTTNRIRGNIGFNPLGNTVVAVPASGTPYSNNLGFDVEVFITGGTVTGVAIGGVSTGLTSGSFRLPAGQTITLTYSVAPTWTFFGD